MSIRKFPGNKLHVISREKEWYCNAFQETLSECEISML